MERDRGLPRTFAPCRLPVQRPVFIGRLGMCRQSSADSRRSFGSTLRGRYHTQVVSNAAVSGNAALRLGPLHHGDSQVDSGEVVRRLLWE